MQPRPQCFSVTPYYRRHFLDMANGFQIWSTQAGHEETAGGFEPIRLRNILNELCINL